MSRSLPSSVVEIGRRAVAAGALADLDRAERRRFAGPVGREPHRGPRIPPMRAAEAIGEPVPDLVQPGAGAELGGDERQAGQGGDRQEARAERSTSLRFVGLRRAVEPGEQESGMLAETRPRPPTTAGRRRPGRPAADRPRRGPGSGPPAPARAAPPARRNGSASARFDGFPGQSSTRSATAVPGRSRSASSVQRRAVNGDPNSVQCAAC